MVKNHQHHSGHHHGGGNGDSGSDRGFSAHGRQGRNEEQSERGKVYNSSTGSYNSGVGYDRNTSGRDTHLSRDGYDRGDSVKYAGQFSSEYGREHYLATQGYTEKAPARQGDRQHYERNYGSEYGHDFDRENYPANRNEVRDRQDYPRGERQDRDYNRCRAQGYGMQPDSGYGNNGRDTAQKRNAGNAQNGNNTNYNSDYENYNDESSRRRSWED